MHKIELLLLQYFEYLDSKGKIFNTVVGLLCSAGVGVFDLLSPDVVSHSFLYILPITFVAWFAGLRLGLALSLVCSALWSVNNVGGSLYISAWNVGSTLLFFFSSAAMIHKFRDMLTNEKILARTDPLTGAKNLRAFSELVEYDMLRAQRDRSPFSLAYLDLDNFKQVNDICGHSAGDELLTAIVTNIVANLRKTDVVGRLGGDEFAIFLPETDQPSAQVVLQKVNQELTKLMVHAECPTSFSMGVLTCEGGIHPLDKLIHYADTLMYEVKHSGKNNIRYAIYPPDDQG
ncbi:putative diguanylate cyclase [Desulfuromonas soudanensis]|uniref:diguanylate cyclase n=1 Tax=Desulfuromonas soudanensis TaxID=1603606 RepID=A0A0M4D896_9BACT|nr:GGDEF domain-containing protein [Desulfuromonas soudanensis]ALC15880.1 putative diguanylate cyclase [Desulfuromonas soudanensis]